MGAFRDLTGMRFGRLVVVRHRKERPHITWLCRCDCGKEKWVLGYDLWQKKTKSCGCLRKEGPKPRHGQAARACQTRTYRVWKNMMQRCYNEKTPQYKDYGGRGIKVDERWWNFAVFYADMGNCPVFQHRPCTIEREDNNGNYTHANCVWAPRITQANNTRRNLMITHNGKTQSLAAWCRELEVPYSRTYQRIRAANQPPEIAFRD